MAGDEETDVAPETFAGRLSDAALHCRTYGHYWRPRTADYSKKDRVWDVVLACRCKAEKHQVLDKSGGIVTSSINYRDGYLATNVRREPGSRLGRDVFRLESVLRFTHQAERRLG